MFESQVPRQGVRICQREIFVGVKFQSANRRHPAQAEIDPHPAVVDLSDRSIGERFDLKLQQSAKMLRPSQVAGHPVEVEGATGKHARSLNVLVRTVARQIGVPTSTGGTSGRDVDQHLHLKHTGLRDG